MRARLSCSSELETPEDKSRARVSIRDSSKSGISDLHHLAEIAAKCLKFVAPIYPRNICFLAAVSWTSLIQIVALKKPREYLRKIACSCHLPGSASGKSPCMDFWKPAPFNAVAAARSLMGIVIQR